MTNVLRMLNNICKGWIVEHRFDSTRKFRFDYGNLKLKIAVEIEGGIYTGKGHVTIKRYLSDMEKYNDAQLRRWIVLRYATNQEHLIANDVKRAIEIREKEKLEKEKMAQK